MHQPERITGLIRPQLRRTCCGLVPHTLSNSNLPAVRSSCKEASAVNMEDIRKDLPPLEHIRIRWIDGLNHDTKAYRTIANVIDTIKIGSILAAAISPLAELPIVVPIVCGAIAYGLHRFTKHVRGLAANDQTELNNLTGRN